MTRKMNLFYVSYFGIIATTMSSSSFAGTATLRGYGQVTTQPEFVSVTIQVKSDCYPSAVTASTANDQIATKVLGMLKQTQRSSGENEITATGGFVEKYSGYDSRTNRAICVGKFRKQNQLTLKSYSTSTFSQTFSTLQDGIYRLGMDSSPSSEEAPNTYLEISTPVTGITQAKTRLLERKALTMALQDAKEKFALTLEMAGIKSYSITNFSETDHVLRPIASERSARMSAPIQFGSLSVESALSVEFQFTGGAVVLP